MRKICIFIRTLNKGGAEKQSMLLAKVLKKHYHVTLIVRKGNQIDKDNLTWLEENKIEFYPLLGSSFVRLAKFFKFLRKHRIEIIFAYLTSDNFWAAITGKLARVSYIIGGIRNAELPASKLFITKFLSRNFFSLIILNNYAAVKLLTKKGMQTDQCVIIPNAIEIEKPKIIRIDSTKTRVLTVGRFVAQKDFKTALRAIGHLVKKYSLTSDTLEYNIAGFGPFENMIRGWIVEFGLSDFVKIHIRPEYLERLYKECDVYLCSSIFEGTSNTIMEALGYNLPIVATNVGDNNLLVKENINGYLIPASDFKLMGERVYELVSNFEKRSQFGIAGYTMLHNNYSLARFEENYCNLINSRLCKK